MRILLALLFGLAVGPAYAQLHPTSRTVITQAVEQAIRPGFDAFDEATQAMHTDMSSLCEAPSDAALATAREGFRAVIIAWSRVELYRFGPLMTENRSDRILFWPDRKGIALRQVQAILANQDRSAIDPGTLRQKSVAVQGLGALELVLFGTDAETLTTGAAGFRCSYGRAIAAAVSEIAGHMKNEWADPSEISARLIRPSQDDADYRDSSEVLQQLVGVMAHGLEAIRDQRILPFLGRDGAKPKPRSALFWRSNLTLPSILGNFEGLEALLAESEIWQYAPTEQFWIGEGAKAAFAGVRLGGGRVTGTVEQALADPAQRRAIGNLVIASQALGKLIGEELPSALGLSVGFSSLDRD